MSYIGNQTSCWTKTPTEPFEYALAQHFGAFEWFPDKKPEGGWDEMDLDEGTRRSIRERAQGGSMRLSVHARWQVDPFSSEGYSLLGKDLGLARDLGAVLLNIHFVHEHGVDAFVKAIGPLVQQTAEADLQLAIENTPLHAPEQFNELFSRLQALDSVSAKHVGMCLDVGHANLCSATRNDYLKFFDRLVPQVPIIHLHVHENWGDSDSHLTLFTGPAARDDSGIRGLIARLRQREFCGSIILEQWPQPPSLLNQARDRLLQLWPNAEDEPPKKPLPTRSNQKSAENTPSPAGFAGELVSGDRHARSWREKLDSVLGLLADESRSLTSDDLIDIAIYLRFLGTGEIRCSEDGRHFRPASHARIAAKIQDRLKAINTVENAFIIRRIYPWLPSSAEMFQRPEPLTRIRDIAHRNDISSELKREIKTTLQNKLHRCAGPEDLVVATALLARITAPGSNYSPDFVEQFRTFQQELKEFFNAQSLDRRLEALKNQVGTEVKAAIDQFLKSRTGESLLERMSTLEALTSLREVLLRPPQEESRPSGNELLLADIALENFAFVLLSEIINACESSDKDPALESEVKALILALANLGLSCIDSEESSAVEHELRRWSPLGKPAQRDEILRLKSTVLRCRRLAETVGQRFVDLFSKRVEQIGPALGVAPHAIRVFCESDVRSHLIFQVAKLASALLRTSRHRLQLPAWDVLVSGRASGRVRSVPSLDQVKGADEPVIVLSENAAGDEEIPSNVAAIVLNHELPHLSHLGVRARQAGIVFVTCEERSEADKLSKTLGQVIALQARPDSVTWELVAGVAKPVGTQEKPAPQIPAVRIPPEASWLPLDRTQPDNSGGKAYGARLLAELPQGKEIGFRTPASVVVPFGVMEEALASAPETESLYRKLIIQLKESSSGNKASVLPRLRDLVGRLPVPQVIEKEVTRKFPGTVRLVVRSSANCEDLEKLAGAGLYDSVINVLPAEVAPAIKKVWASLWTERAAFSRQEAKIPHERAHMAVLIQELIEADLSFILHTVNPVTLNDQDVYAEIVVGLGETLASAATRGTPYRLVCAKGSGTTMTEAFANFSQAARIDPQGGLRFETVDYSRIDLSLDPVARQELGGRLAALGSLVERALGKPQDIEGAVRGKQIYLVQARPQQGLSLRNSP
jgi:phosphoglucan,water dikinase